MASTHKTACLVTVLFQEKFSVGSEALASGEMRNTSLTFDGLVQISVVIFHINQRKKQF